MKIKCLFCNSNIQITEKTQCIHCKAFALINEEDFSFLHDAAILKNENKIRRERLNSEQELLMYYPYTDEQLSLMFTKKQLEALNKVLNNVTLDNADRSRLFLMRKKIFKIKKNIKKFEFVKTFESPELRIR